MTDNIFGYIAIGLDIFVFIRDRLQKTKQKYHSNQSFQLLIKSYHQTNYIKVITLACKQISVYMEGNYPAPFADGRLQKA